MKIIYSIFHLISPGGLILPQYSPLIQSLIRTSKAGQPTPLTDYAIVASVRWLRFGMIFRILNSHDI